LPFALEIYDIYNALSNPYTDGDDIHDEDDDYPGDPTRAFDTYHQSSTLFGTIANEDNWPSKGDYDFNDLVMDYNFNQILNADNLLVEIEGIIKLMAIGAGFHNGFSIQFPFAANKVQSLNNGGNEFIEFETGTTYAVLQIFSDAFALMHPPAGASGTWVNTVPGETYVIPVVLEFSIILTESLDINEFNYLPPYNPFYNSKRQSRA